jgi:predicted transcriptional regulator
METKVSDIINKLHLQVFSGENGLSKTVTGAYSSDLLSDVMGNANENHIWITLQTHKNIMAVASLKDLAAIILVKGFNPDDDTIVESNKLNIPILGTSLNTFELCGKLYEILK